MARIAIVENGKIVIRNEFGGWITSFTPQGSKKAIFVDTNPSDGRMLVTMDDGSVSVYNQHNGLLNSMSNCKNVVLARWMGNDVFVQHSDGTKELRRPDGGWIKSM
ncbi:MAG: hypothetical protein J1F43_06565 [Muribaculaceae bacterium]|nr:hypothetical protein [Muribaculaceae bacterium]